MDKIADLLDLTTINPIQPIIEKANDGLIEGKDYRLVQVGRGVLGIISGCEGIPLEEAEKDLKKYEIYKWFPANTNFFPESQNVQSEEYIIYKREIIN